MEERIKVFNPNKYDVGLKLFDGRELVIRHGSFAKLTQDEINYVASISTTFSKGELRVDESRPEIPESLGINVEEDIHFITDEEIQKKISGSQNKLKAWLDEINDDYVLHRVADVASKMELTTGKVKILMEKIPEYNPID